jgi:hypothetical protein
MIRLHFQHQLSDHAGCRAPHGLWLREQQQPRPSEAINSNYSIGTK